MIVRLAGNDFVRPAVYVWRQQLTQPRQCFIPSQIERETGIFGNTRKPALSDVFNKFCTNTCYIQVGSAVELEVGIRNANVAEGWLPCVKN